MTSDELQEKEENITNEIKERGKNLDLILDGVVSVKNYLDEKNKYKIMWILKEGYSDLGFKIGTDLLDPKEREKKAAGYINPALSGMIYVTYGLLNDKSFEEMYAHKIDSEMVEVLTRIAWVNVSEEK